MNTDESLDAVLRCAREEQPVIDIVLSTGDISMHGDQPSYRRYREKVSPLASKHAYLPGNHDKVDLMQAELAEQGGWQTGRVDLGKWQLIMLSSLVEGRVGGFLADSELELLSNSLKNHPEQHTLVCVHHHTLPVNCEWLDQQRISNHDKLLGILSQYPSVHGLLCGHVHQDTEVDHQGIKVMSTPSTCVQFAENSDDFGADGDVNPGYRWLILHDDGRIETAVSRVKHQRFALDLDARGYE